MDDVGQGHVVDASLAFLQKLEDDMRALNESQLDSSDSSTLDSPGGARKRRRLESSSENEASKRTRTASCSQDSVVFGPAEPPRRDRSRQLPAELWHRVFSFLPPNTLGRLLRVNQLFHKYLDPASPFIISTVTHVPTTRILPTLSPDAIWRASRSLHWPTMPAPLKGKFELDMWRFACTRSCQLCGLLDTNYATPEDSLRRCGPGNATVSPIFSFFVNSCGNCLTETSVQEVDLLLSTSSPSFISPGLPMVFLTPDANVISPQAMRSTPVPPTVRLTKVYWPAQVDRLQEELEEVKRFGIAATEEWIKGLDVRGTEAVRDTSRWDKWFQMGGVRQMRIYSSQPRPTANKAERVERKGPDTTKPLQKPRQDIETAVRLHVSSLADEVISQWLKGHSIKGNCADFVTEVLTYVRTQFYKGAVFLTRRLTLDDMRWIFEQKIGPHTNCLQQDFLFCRECPKSSKSKSYGFQAVMQHYAMKHGSKKMKAMIWRAEWPEVPPFRAEEKAAADMAPAQIMHPYSDKELVYSESHRTDEQPRFESREALDRMTTQYIVREPDEWSNPTWGPAHLSSSVGSRHHDAPEPRRHLESYYLRREHVPHMIEAPYPVMESQRERRLAEVETRHTSRQSYVSGYRQPMPSTALYRSYDIFDMRSLPNDRYMEQSTILHDYRFPSNANYSNYTNRESHNNTASASRVYSAYDSRGRWPM